MPLNLPILPPASRSRVDLNGQWERWVGDKLYDVVEVPSSLHPSGYYQLRREFLLPELSAHQRAYLHFEAITYFARVSVNSTELGTMGPYVPYEFDFTRQARKGKNTVEVAIADLTPDPSGAGKDELALGVNPGWEAYGGIIRDVHAEVRPAAFIDNVRFGYKLNSDYTHAACRAQVMVSALAESSGEVELALLRAGSEMARVQQKTSLGSGASEVELEFSVPSPALWSPEEPNLYEIHARLTSDHGEDAWRCRTGFREVVTRGTGLPAQRQTPGAARRGPARYVEGARFHPHAPPNGRGHADDQGDGSEFHPLGPLPASSLPRRPRR